MGYKEILRIAPVVTSASLVGRSLSLAKKKKKRSNDFLKGSTDIIVGSSLIKAQAEVIG